MAQLLTIHPTNPQSRFIEQAVTHLNKGGIVAIPTDARFVLACAVDNHSAQQQLRTIRKLDDSHLFSLLCQNLAQVAEYAQVDDAAFRVLKTCLPGSYTVILKGTKNLGKKICHPKRKTVGIRIAKHAVVQALITRLGIPLVASSLVDDEGNSYTDAETIHKEWSKRIAVIIDTNEYHAHETTILDLTCEPYECVRQGVAPIPW